MRPAKRAGRDDGRKEPLEWLAMLAGKSNYMIPVEGRSTAAPAITSLDVAHAIASAEDKVGAAVGLAVACQRPQLWMKVHEDALDRLREQLERQHLYPGVVAGERRFRARLVLRDAFDDLVFPARRVSYANAIERIRDALGAGRAPMSREVYAFIHKSATGMLQAASATAAGQACRFLFARDLPPSTGMNLMLAGVGGVDQIEGCDAGSLTEIARFAWAPKLSTTDLDWLLAEIERDSRPRAIGVLSLGGAERVAVLS